MWKTIGHIMLNFSTYITVSICKFYYTRGSADEGAPCDELCQLKSC